MRSLSAIEIQKSWWPCEGHATLKVPHIADRLASMKSIEFLFQVHAGMLETHENWLEV